MSIADRLRESRSLAGLSQGQIARLADTTKQSISEWERGQRTPGVDVLARLAGYYGVSLDWLATGREAPLPAGLGADLAKLAPDDRAAVERLVRRLPKENE